MARRRSVRPNPIPPEVEKVATQIVDAAYKVHTALGPGLLESVYETCLSYEFKRQHMKHARQVELPIVYESLVVDRGLSLDLLVEDVVVCELKAVENVPPVAMAQMLTYLKLVDKRLGFLINFNVSKIKDGIQRVIL